MAARFFPNITQCRTRHEAEPPWLQLILILNYFTWSCDESPMPITVHLIRTEATHSTMTDPLLSLSPQSPAITKSSWICLPNFSRVSICPSPVTFLAQISLLSHQKYCSGLLTALQQLLQASSNQCCECSGVIFPNAIWSPPHHPTLPQTESFIYAVKCQVITTYIHST